MLTAAAISVGVSGMMIGSIFYTRASNTMKGVEKRRRYSVVLVIVLSILHSNYARNACLLLHPIMKQQQFSAELIPESVLPTIS